MHIGVHVTSDDPVDAAAARGADAVQLFLSDPQGYEAPPVRDDEDRLRRAGMPVYVHAPYLVNVASGNNRIRVPSRRILQDTCDAATRIGAAAVIVHGGHVDADTPLEDGFGNWRKALDRVETDVSILIENTASGDHAVARRVETIERLWEVIDGARASFGLCLDTCHAHAAGEPLDDLVARVRAAAGSIALVHANNSRDPSGSGRDRHARPREGTIDAETLAAVVAASDAPVILETPGDTRQHASDVAWLRTRLEQRRG